MVVKDWDLRDRKRQRYREREVSVLTESDKCLKTCVTRSVFGY
jgi:hypothetical protein